MNLVYIHFVGFEVLDHYEVVFKLATLHDQPYCKPKDRVFIVNKVYITIHRVKLSSAFCIASCMLYSIFSHTDFQ